MQNLLVPDQRESGVGRTRKSRKTKESCKVADKNQKTISIIPSKIYARKERKCQERKRSENRSVDRLDSSIGIMPGSTTDIYVSDSSLPWPRVGGLQTCSSTGAYGMCQPQPGIWKLFAKIRRLLQLAHVGPAVRRKAEPAARKILRLLICRPHLIA